MEPSRPTHNRPTRFTARGLALLLAGLLAATAAAAGSSATVAGASGSNPPTRLQGAIRASQAGAVIRAVGAENEYADVIAQVGGPYVAVNAIESNPNTDPHTFEASPAVARTIASAQLVVQNGLGYDDYINQIESAQPDARRLNINVQHLLGLPDSTPNPHLWYKPSTMPAVAAKVADDLAVLDPARAAAFHVRALAFDRSLQPWHAAIAALKALGHGAPVATTEPVGDYLLQAAGLDNKTPWTLQADIMNGVDPSPQGVSFQESLFSQHKVRVFVYNQQVVDQLTATFLQDARQDHIAVVGVYETMPTGYHYQRWMLAETVALERALRRGVSTTGL